MQFEVGNKAVVPNLGVGIVMEIREEDHGGTPYQMYVIKILDNGLTYKCPLDQLGANGVREPIPEEGVEKVYDILRDRETKPDKQTWNRRYRAYQEKIKTGDLLEVGAVLRDLARLRTEKTLSFGERKMFDKAHSLIVQELAVARDVDEQVIKDEIEEIFKV